jgi:uncharacterized membrane protein
MIVVDGEIAESFAGMKVMMEIHKRTFARTVTYRLAALLITALWTGLSTAIFIHLVLTAVHYIHERLWLMVKWGRIES